ncbi:MAG: hypothetical protein HZB29_06350 [Nitrospinae bacterium]|nr:hypothetical protein [Nitrospinota bacterium]
MAETWVKCDKCGTEMPEELKICVKCGNKIKRHADKSLKWIPNEEIPANPTAKEIDFDNDGQTYVALVFLKMKDEWNTLTREKKIENSVSHMNDLRKYAKLVNRNMLYCQGISKYDMVEIIEANDLKIINSLIRSMKAGAKGRYIDIVDTVCGISGLSMLSTDAIR